MFSFITGIPQLLRHNCYSVGKTLVLSVDLHYNVKKKWQNRCSASMWELPFLVLHCVFSGYIINVKNGIPIIQLSMASMKKM